MPGRDMPNLAEDDWLPAHAQGCAHSSRTSRRAESPLSTGRRLGLFRSCHPIPSIGVGEARERLVEEDAEADHSFIAGFTISNTRGRLPTPGFRLRPTVSAGLYDPLVIICAITTPRRGGAERPRAAEKCRRHLILADPPAYEACSVRAPRLGHVTGRA
jgi:hypothetical protein